MWKDMKVEEGQEGEQTSGVQVCDGEQIKSKHLINMNKNVSRKFTILYN